MGQLDTKGNVQIHSKVRVQNCPYTLDDEEGQRVVCNLPHVPFAKDRLASPLRYLGQSRMSPVTGARFDRGGGRDLPGRSQDISGHGRRHDRLNESSFDVYPGS